MSSRFMQNRDCEFFPCHAGADPEKFNCLFCYCPLYALGDRCGGGFTYANDGIKDCSRCLFPHQAENYDRVCEKLAELIERCKKE
ncbi:MAG: metal-binding protein [Clostridiales bacterium]|nr:metal-binding protein [Clostridiales bacterium]